MSEHTQPMRAPLSQVSLADTDASTAQCTLPATGFALAELFERISEVSVECEPALATPDDHALVTIRTDECEHVIDDALRSAPNVAAVERFGERTDGWIYRVTWEGRPRRLIGRLVDADITLLSLRGRGGQWKLRLLTPDRAGIARAHDIMDDLGCETERWSIATFDGGLAESSTLTDEQRTALVTAFEVGHYDIPRDVTAAEVATELGISHQALSERFRRAYRNLIEREFVVTEKQH